MDTACHDRETGCLADCLNFCGDDSRVARGEIPRCPWYQNLRMAEVRADAEKIDGIMDAAFGKADIYVCTRDGMAAALVQLLEDRKWND